MLKKLSYAVDEYTYNEIFEDFVQETPEVVTYCHMNWHGIKKELVQGLKSFHLQKDITNRVESFFSLKEILQPQVNIEGQKRWPSQLH